MRLLWVGAAIVLAGALFVLVLARSDRGLPTSDGVMPGPTEPLNPLKPPTVEIVRVDPDGTLVASGLAEPYGKIEIDVEDTELGEFFADDQGAWIATPTIALEAGAHRVAVTLTAPDGRRAAASDTVVVIVPAQRGPRPLVVQSPPDGPSRVLQAPSLPLDQPMSLEAIELGAAGTVAFGGRAEPGSRLMAYLDGRPVGQALTEDTGDWSLTPKPAALEPGRHTVRIDRLDEAGSVTARLSVNFERPAPEAFALPSEETLSATQVGAEWRLTRRSAALGSRTTLVIGPEGQKMGEPTALLEGQIVVPVNKAPAP